MLVNRRTGRIVPATRPSTTRARPRQEIPSANESTQSSFWKLTLAFICSAGVWTFFGLCLALGIDALIHPHLTQAGIHKGFSSGYIPNEFKSRDVGATLERQELHGTLERVLRPPSFDGFGLIVGAAGTGKSTAIRQLCRQTPLEGPNRVVYVAAGSPDGLVEQLSEAFGFDGVVSAFLMSVRETLSGSRAAFSLNWNRVSHVLLKAAFSFRQQHGVPVTLVIDDTNKILKAYPTFVDSLLYFAKTAADQGHLQVVFVSSDFAVLSYFRGKSEYTRCAGALEVADDDISVDAAVEFLTKKLGGTAEAKVTAEVVVREVTGTRCGFLSQVPKEVNQTKAFQQRLVNDLRYQLKTMKLHGKCDALFQRLLVAEAQLSPLPETDPTVVGVDDELLDQLVKRNVLVKRVCGGYNFAARYIATFFRKQFEAL